MIHPSPTMPVPQAMGAACCAVATMVIAPCTQAAPVAFDVGIVLVAPGAVGVVDVDLNRQGYVTAHRSPLLVAATQGQARPKPRAGLNLATGTNMAVATGWTINTAVSVASVFSPFLSAIPTGIRADAAPATASTLVSSFKLADMGQLDDTTRALKRLIDGQSISSEADLLSMLFGQN